MTTAYARIADLLLQTLDDGDVPILLQKSQEEVSGARMESESRPRRIDVALLRSAANQCCALQPAKSFCNLKQSSDKIATLDDAANHPERAVRGAATRKERS